MKIKTNSSNPFKYVSFTDQIAKMSVDIARWHPSIIAVTSAENETHFNDAITKYRDLDYGSYFENFLNDIPYFNGELRTYAQLLHQKDIVAEALINHLSISESTSLNTLLELTTAFVQDLREDFRSYIWEFIEVIMDILERSHEDKEILEIAFFTLAKIFWLQRRHLVRELREVFRRCKRIFCCKRSYLRRFSAEALAFLFRKSSAVGKLTVFLAETAHSEINNSLLIDGLSRLYFNVLKITRGQFHSTAPQVLSEILSATLEIEEDHVRNIAVQILIGTICQCSIYTSKEYSELVVDVILKQYKSAVSSSDTMKSSELARLLNAWINQKMGRSLHSPSSLFQVIIDGAKNRGGEMDRETIELLSTAIMRYHGDSNLHVLITAAVRALMSSDKRWFDVKLNFLCDISNIPLFDICLMPVIGTFMSRIVVQEDTQTIRSIFKFYADICNKRRPIWENKERRNCFFDISHHLEVRSRLTDILKSADKFDAEIVGCCLMTYPWLWSQSENPKDIAAVFKILVSSMSYSDSVDARLSLLAANACFLFDPSLFAEFTLDTLLKYYRNMGSNETALRTLALMLPYVKDSDELKNISAMSKVANEILPMFGHWSSDVRQVALEILTHFTIPLNDTENNGEGIIEAENAFNLLLRSERIPWTLEEYRTRLMILRQLTYGAHIKHMPQGFDTIIETIPLRVIIGNLYEPFTIAWNELKNIIQDYAYGLNIDAFFSIFIAFLDQMGLKSQHVMPENDGNSNCDMLDKMAMIADRSPRNYAVFRLEMLRFLSRISDLCERRTKLLSPLFIRFFRNEYQQENLLDKRENILLSSSCSHPYSADENNGNEIINVDANGDPQLFSTEKSKDECKKTKDDKYIGRKLIRSSLIALLELFANFTSPKSIYLANEIRDLYDELLLVGDESVQQRALKCILTYNYKYLLPYREHLENLVQERTLINGLMKFSIDEHNSVIDSIHRADVMPIVLKLLYGKSNIYCKKDMTERRAAIFRFLAGSRSEELDFFLKLLFAPLLKVIGGEEQSLEIFCKRTVSNFDASSMVPIQVIKGSFRSISLIATVLSPVLKNAQRRLLFRVCLAAALFSRLALQNLIPVQIYLVKRLKELRRLACNAFKEVFYVSQNYMLDADEINAFLVHIVVPQCMFCNDSSPKVPFNFLRLFLSWTSIPKLFYLLRLQVPSVGGAVPQSIVSILCSMLTSRKVSKLMKEKIVDGLLNLLTLADEVMIEPVTDIDLIKLSKIPGLNSGTSMVLPELPKILAFIFDSLPLQSENRKLNTKHLEILNRVSEFIEDEEMIKRYVSILLTFLESGVVHSDDAVYSSLLTVLRMIAVAVDVNQFLKNLINVQSMLKERSHRETLQKIEETIAIKLMECDKKKAELMSYLASLDAWDGRRIDEPDYDKRHDAYQNLCKALTTGEVIDPVLLYLLLHNDYYVIVQINEISLRSAAVKNFRCIIEYFGRHNINDGIDSHMIPLVLMGLHNPKEVIRDDFTILLVSMIACFPAHRDLRYLASLRNTEEVDLDFFENVTHMQIHRRQRAFYKLAQSLQSEEIRIPNGVLLRFVLPILQPYLTHFSSSTSALSDAALALFTQIMRGAPWKKYLPMLDFYIKRLRKESVNVNHKAIIRIIVALVDAFHFNVSEGEQHESAIKLKKTTGELGTEASSRFENGVEARIEEVTSEPVANDILKKNISSIYQKVVGYLIPQLKDCAVGKDLVSHRKAQSGKYYKEDDDIQRTPVALATVKLLQKMPQNVMDYNLPGVIIKICSLLMSRSGSVREAAGKTIIEIAKILGPKYIHFIIREMKQTMKKGYQLHVMIFYVHKLLSAMEEQLHAGDLDSSLMDIVDVCTMDLFGSVAEEKAVSGITRDVPEAKIQRTYETYRLLGRFISSQSLGSVLVILKKIIESAPDAKTVRKVSRLLGQYSLGISSNEGIEPGVALVFAYQLLNDQIIEVLKENKSGFQPDAQQTSERTRSESCLVLEKEPTRIGMVVKMSAKSKMHIFVEFALSELYLVLKKKTFDVESKDDVARLDPFVDIILQCLKLKYDKILVNSLRCFLILLKFPLPSLRSIMTQFLDRLFILLADYTTSDAIGKIQEYVRKSLEVSQLVFKAITQIIKDAPSLVLTSKRLQLLLTHVETDIADNQKQAVAFPLIKVIILRKLQDPKVIEIIQYLAETAIVSEVSHIREQCRQVIAVFISYHPQCKKPSKYAEFFLEQLDYQHESGRKSAIEMLNMFFEKLTEEINDDYALLAFVKLAARLMNDESAECRQMIVLAIEKLVVSVSESKRNDLYLAAKDWLESKKEVYICIAVQALVIFTKLEGENFGNSLRDLLPRLSKIVHSDVLYSYTEESIGIIINNLNLLISDRKDQTVRFAEEGLLDSILREIGPFARCSESPIVQLSAARFLGSLFSMLSKEYLLSLSNPSVREFTQWTLAQMKTYKLTSELADEVAKNLVYLFDIIAQSDDDLQWFCHRLSVLCNFELVKLPAETIRRCNIFKVTAVIVLKIDPIRTDIVVQSLLPPIYREILGKSTQSTEILQKIAMEVVETIKGKIGDEKFTKQIAECSKKFAAKLEERKRKQKEEAVLDPTSAARKKIRKNKQKMKKRRIV